MAQRDIFRGARRGRAGVGRARADAFAAALPEAEFKLRKQFVADILVSDRQLSGDAIRLTVEALLLDE